MTGSAILNRILYQPDSLVGQIAEWVGLAIIEGRLAPGDDLNSVDLAGRFSTSRTPVREALMLLAKEGLVEIPPRRRPRVALLGIEDVREIYQVRASLYALVAELILAPGSEPDLGALQPHLTQMEVAALSGDLDGYFWANVAFRDAETALCGNRQLGRMLDSLMLRTLQLRRLSLSLPGRIDQSLADHQRLMRAYQERDLAMAVALKRSIVYGGLRAIEHSGWTGKER